MPGIAARRLTDAGIALFRQYLEGLAAGNDAPPPPELRDGSRFTDAVPCSVTFDPDRQFGSRYELGGYVRDRIAACEAEARERTVTDPAFWAWLAVLWFEQLCPRDRETGRRRPRRFDHYIPRELVEGARAGRSTGDVWGRHAVRTSWLLVDRYDGLVDFVLCGPPDTRGQLTESLLGTADIVLCPAAVGAAAALYRGADGRPKVGAGSKSEGTVRRFAPVVRQLMRNYDLYEADAQALLDLLPAEFDRFRA